MRLIENKISVIANRLSNRNFDEDSAFDNMRDSINNIIHYQGIYIDNLITLDYLTFDIGNEINRE